MNPFSSQNCSFCTLKIMPIKINTNRRLRQCYTPVACRNPNNYLADTNEKKMHWNGITLLHHMSQLGHFSNKAGKRRSQMKLKWQLCHFAPVMCHVPLFLHAVHLVLSANLVFIIVCFDSSNVLNDTISKQTKKQTKTKKVQGLWHLVQKPFHKAQ